ncbi:H/ACA ribonucleoprotein complex non-core subunit NAF1 isoform X2 [Harpegnathos saltator]|uniref:H/ACA ribonucleoprotein complex non-core subunit NAF1 isoform X2 n=1 Tax=Harpegnathos saltator TaxID=610380 RepID=UPI000DBEF048|nr:H/ACA ribonucleoprotein complex non-core subunit NAF1 isoform X2 [Harpegnathos saltator]
METNVDVDTKNAHTNSMSTETKDIENKTSLDIIALEYEDSDLDVKETILNKEEAKNQHIVKIIDAQIDTQINIQADVQIGLQADAQTDTQADAQTDTQADAQTDTQADAQVDTHTDIQNLHQYRQKIDEVLLSDSSDSESDSSSSSSTSTNTSSRDSSNSSDNDSDNSDDNDDNKMKKRIKMNTLKPVQIQSELNGLPPVEDLKISVSEVTCDLFGEIIGIVEELVIIKPRAEKPALREETVLFIEQGQKTLGKIFDIFGPVKEPHYTIRFNNVEHIQERQITVGTPVYYCPDSCYTFFVFLSELTKIKGSDANCDGGSDGDHPDFSDDEEEKRYYEKLNRQRRNPARSSGDGTQKSSKRMCTLNSTPTLTNSTANTVGSRAPTLSTSSSNSTGCRPRNARDGNYQFQGHSEYGHRPTWRNSGQLNRANQFNVYRPFYGNPRNACFTYDMSPLHRARYPTPPFNVPPSSQYSNSDDSDYRNQYYPAADMNTQYDYVSRYPNPSFADQTSWNPLFYNSNYPMAFVHSSAQYTHTFWPSASLPLPPPPPPPPPPSPMGSTNNQ